MKYLVLILMALPLGSNAQLPLRTESVPVYSIQSKIDLERITLSIKKPMQPVFSWSDSYYQLLLRENELYEWRKLMMQSPCMAISRKPRIVQGPIGKIYKPVANYRFRRAFSLK